MSATKANTQTADAGQNSANEEPTPVTLVYLKEMLAEKDKWLTAAMNGAEEIKKLRHEYDALLSDFDNARRDRRELTAERDTLKAENDKLRAALETIATSATPLADCPWTGFTAKSLDMVLSRLAEIARAALATGDAK